MPIMVSRPAEMFVLVTNIFSYQRDKCDVPIRQVHIVTFENMAAIE
jgi:hypothetical protein